MSHIYSIDYSPNGEKIVSGGDKIITEWDVISGKSIKTYEAHSSEIKSVKYSSDGKKILSGSKDGLIREWDTDKSNCLRTIKDIFGLFIQGVDMRNLHPASEITDEERKLLKQYGAILDEESLSMSEIKLLHISDLHFDGSETDR